MGGNPLMRPQWRHQYLIGLTPLEKVEVRSLKVVHVASKQFKKKKKKRAPNLENGCERPLESEQSADTHNLCSDPSNVTRVTKTHYGYNGSRISVRSVHWKQSPIRQHTVHTDRYIGVYLSIGGRYVGQSLILIPNWHDCCIVGSSM